MRVLVTGGAGFIGSHVCERFLSDGHRVVSYDNFNDYYSPSAKRENIEAIRRHAAGASFESVEADVRDGEALNRVFDRTKPDVVIHLAAMVGVRPSLEQPRLYYEVNVAGTEEVLKGCRGHGVGRVILASSSSVYGLSDRLPFSEDDSADRPLSVYAATKRAMEFLGHAAYAQYGLAVCALRFFTVYGPRQRPDLAIHRFTRLLLRGETISLYGDGGASRDFTYVGDVTEAVAGAARWLAGLSGPEFEIFNIGGAHPVSLKELVGLLEKVSSRPCRVRHESVKAGDMEHTAADIRKAKKILGYSPSTDMETGLRHFMEWHSKKTAGALLS